MLSGADCPGICPRCDMDVVCEISHRAGDRCRLGDGNNVPSVESPRLHSWCYVIPILCSLALFSCALILALVPHGILGFPCTMSHSRFLSDLFIVSCSLIWFTMYHVSYIRTLCPVWLCFVICIVPCMVPWYHDLCIIFPCVLPPCMVLSDILHMHYAPWDMLYYTIFPFIVSSMLCSPQLLALHNA